MNKETIVVERDGKKGIEEYEPKFRFLKELLDDKKRLVGEREYTKGEKQRLIDRHNMQIAEYTTKIDALNEKIALFKKEDIDAEETI